MAVKMKELKKLFPMAAMFIIAILVVMPLGAIYTPQETITVAQATAAGLEKTYTPPDGSDYPLWNSGANSFKLNAHFTTPTPAGWKDVYGNHTVVGGHTIASLNLTGYTPLVASVDHHTISFAFNTTANTLITNDVLGIRIDVPVGMREPVKGIDVRFGSITWVDSVGIIGAIQNESVILINQANLEYAAAVAPLAKMELIFTMDDYPQNGDNYDFALSFYGDKGNYTGEYSAPFDSLELKGMALITLGGFQIFAALFMTDTIDLSIKKR